MGWRSVVGLSVAMTVACSAPKQLAQEPPAESASTSAPTPSVAPAPGPPREPGAPNPSLPVVGDPLGLLSKPPASAPARPAPARSEKFDPGALMASAALAPPTQVEIERDPRAVARGQLPNTPTRRAAAPSASATVQPKRAAEVLASVRNAAARPHVLYLYASYCKACRHVLPSFLELVRSYRERGVLFTAASVDHDAEQFAAYAPALAGVLPALWIQPEGRGVTLGELRRAGLTLPEDSYSIPLFAVFDRGHRLVSQGNTRELARLPQTLEGLL